MWERFRVWPWWAQAFVWLALWPVPVVMFTLTRERGGRRGWWAVSACAGLAWIGIGSTAGAAGDGNRGAEAPARVTRTIVAPTSTTERSTSTERQAPSLPEAPDGGHRTTDVEVVPTGDGDRVVRTPDTNVLLDTLATLTVEAEHPRAGYERALFPHWDDDDHNGCDTRCEVLSAQRTGDGAWFSEWDGYSTGDTSELHVDHVVALAEAWDSGADAWTAAQRDEFADAPPNLLAVTAATNVAKGDGDAAEWFPSRAEANCLWASTVVRVKASWGLSVDQAEHDGLANLLRTCPDYQPPTTTTAPTTTTTRPPATVPPPTIPAPPPPPPANSCTPGYSPCIPPGDDVDCAGGTGNGPRYVDGPVAVDPAGGDRYDLDRDSDGVGCES